MKNIFLIYYTCFTWVINPSICTETSDNSSEDYLYFDKDYVFPELISETDKLESSEIPKLFIDNYILYELVINQNIPYGKNHVYKHGLLEIIEDYKERNRMKALELLYIILKKLLEKIKVNMFPNSSKDMKIETLNQIIKLKDMKFLTMLLHCLNICKYVEKYIDENSRHRYTKSKNIIDGYLFFLEDISKRIIKDHEKPFFRILGIKRETFYYYDGPSKITDSDLILKIKDLNKIKCEVICEVLNKKLFIKTDYEACFDFEKYVENINFFISLTDTFCITFKSLTEKSSIITDFSELFSKLETKIATFREEILNKNAIMALKSGMKKCHRYQILKGFVDFYVEIVLKLNLTIWIEIKEKDCIYMANCISCLNKIATFKMPKYDENIFDGQTTHDLTMLYNNIITKTYNELIEDIIKKVNDYFSTDRKYSTHKFLSKNEYAQKEELNKFILGMQRNDLLSDCLKKLDWKDLLRNMKTTIVNTIIYINKNTNYFMHEGPEQEGHISCVQS